MANADQTGQQRVSRIEKNNRNTSKAKGPATKTPRKMGATKGFGSNRTAQRGQIFKNR